MFEIGVEDDDGDGGDGGGGDRIQDDEDNFGSVSKATKEGGADGLAGISIPRPKPLVCQSSNMALSHTACLAMLAIRGKLT